MKRLFFTLFAGALLIGSINTLPAPAQSPRTPRFLTLRPYSGFPFRKKPTKEQKKLLVPKTEDLSKYGNFLAHPKTGIVKLLPDAGCEENTMVVSAAETCLNAVPNASLYSFREEEHTEPPLADIRMKNGFFISDGILSQGILTNLGDVTLEQISLASDGFEFLRKYEPHIFKKEAQKQHLEMVSGVTAGKYEYRKIHSIVENSTYAMRVIAYRGILMRSFRGFHYDLLGGDDRMDLTLAFRVVRKEDDGSVTLVWKELERRESPKLKVEKKKAKTNAEQD